MKRLSLFPLVVVVLLVTNAGAPVLTQRPVATAAPVSIPFDPAARHVIVQVTVNNSRPLSFILDSGANVAIIRTDVAKELGLKLEGNVGVGGAGSGPPQAGSFVRQATWSLVGLPGFSQPVTLAVPMPELPLAMGRPVDGIIGGEFIKEFVVELDYQARVLKLHDAGAFRYAGAGETIPIEFVNVIHPVLRASVTPMGGQPTEQRFVLDIGASGALTLHSPFVREQKLLDSGLPTIRAIGGAGAGGRVTGRMGRVQALQIGRFVLREPITMFAQDAGGAFANAALAGNIGAQIAMRFRVFLDYGRKRIILEPSSMFDKAFDRAFSGLALRALGDDFRTFRVIDVLEDSPASDAGIQLGDIITSIDEMPASGLTMFRINELFDVARTYTLGIRRGAESLTVKLTTRKMI
jgi:hypothetical protein